MGKLLWNYPDNKEVNRVSKSGKYSCYHVNKRKEIVSNAPAWTCLEVLT